MKTADLLSAGERLEQQMGCALFPDLSLEKIKTASIEDAQRLYRRELEMIMLINGMAEEGTPVEHLRSILQIHASHSRERPGLHREILGFDIKAICSNIRRQDVDWEQYETASSGIGTEGDIVIAQAIGNTGSTNHVENQHGRDVRLLEGDRFLAVLGHRHSGTSEYGGLPNGGTLPISPDTHVDLLCHGGILGEGICVPSSKPCKTFFKVRIAAIVRCGDKNVNLLDLYPSPDEKMLPSAPIIFNCGTSAEIGKTTSSSSIIRALKRKGLKVGATKLAGTGRLRDLLSMRDAGADSYYDFPDVGLASTYTAENRSYPAAITLFNKLNQEGVDVIVAEMGGDIIEANIPAILTSPEVMQYANGIVHSSGDVLGILGSLHMYKQFGVEIPVKITLPKDRNNAGTSDRLGHHGLEAFNTLNEQDCDRIVEELLRKKLS